jgi:hypothetical protein
VRTAVFVLAIATLSAPAAAQAPRVEVSFGLEQLADDSLSVNPRGWYGDLAVNLTPAFGIVGEFAKAHWDDPILAARNREGVNGPLGGSSTTLPSEIQTFLVGGRGSVRTHPRVVPFGQMLFGQSSDNLYSWPDKQAGAALQVGGGANFVVTRRVGARAGADYRRLFHSLADLNEFRLVVGVVVAVR